MNKITKYIALSTFAATAFSFAGCAKSDTNKELAKKIETESTELIYSIETMDNIRLSDLDDETVAANATYTLSSYAVLTENLKPAQSRMQGANPKKYQDKNNETTSSATSTTTTSETKATETESNSNQKVLKLSTNDFGDADQYSNELVSKRSEVMLLCSKLRKGDIKLSKDELSRVNECIALVNDTADYLENSKGKIEKDYKNAKTTASKVALREKLAIRQAKLQTGILAMDEIISIMNGKEKQTTKATSGTKTNNTTAKTTNANTKATSTNTKSVNTTSSNSNSKQSKVTNTSTKTNIVQPNQSTSSKSATAQTTQQTTKSNLKTTNNTQENDAVSILVQPVKTNTTAATSATSNQTQQTNRSNEYIVRRPKNVNSIYNKLPIVSTTAMPEPLPKTDIVPYKSTAQNIGYSV